MVVNNINNVVEPESSVTIKNNIVNNFEQCNIIVVTLQQFDDILRILSVLSVAQASDASSNIIHVISF